MIGVICAVLFLILASLSWIWFVEIKVLQDIVIRMAAEIVVLGGTNVARDLVNENEIELARFRREKRLKKTGDKGLDLSTMKDHMDGETIDIEQELSDAKN